MTEYTKQTLNQMCCIFRNLGVFLSAEIEADHTGRILKAEKHETYGTAFLNESYKAEQLAASLLFSVVVVVVVGSYRIS